MPMHDSARDQILHAMANAGWANESDGNVESVTGWFCRISNSPEELNEVLQAFDEEIGEFARETLSNGFDPNKLVGHFLLVEDDHGFIDVTEFDSEKELRNAYMDLVVAYCNFMDMPAWREDGDDEN